MKDLKKMYYSMNFKKYVKVIQSTTQLNGTVMSKREIESINSTYNKRKNDSKSLNINKKEIKKTGYKLRKLNATEKELVIMRSQSKNPQLLTIVDTKSKFKELVIYMKDYYKMVDIPEIWKSKKKYLIGNKNKINKVNISKEISIPSDLKKKGSVEYKNFYKYFKSIETINNLYTFGEYYIEGNENIRSVNSYYPGILSRKLRNALGISTDAYPPWINQFLKYGLPPSYPNLDVTYGNNTKRDQTIKINLTHSKYYWFN
uniref:mRNA splicing factor 3bA n=1 Tax=Amorphochlora amoebiformis TaxID=1561963 RepID=A0A0H5BR10_9EUKA|nr:mRNA splicing factor 3bA [Amorphochlora amoebiformis]|mmetsp:Transcript_24143/g.38004  ORF Transcript_24143/g.38004 Transcript_24143/m.38004 type:complete len:259 (-) Transcript_24143:3703-4479(-)